MKKETLRAHIRVALLGITLGLASGCLTGCGFYIGFDYNGKTDKNFQTYSQAKPVLYRNAIKPKIEED